MHPLERAIGCVEVTAILEAHDLHVTYRLGGRFRGRDVRALAGLDLAVEAGEVLGVVGESGCGKSTFARTVMGLVKPSSGDLRFRGSPVPRDPSGRRKIQMVFQDPGSSLNPLMTVGQTLSELLRYHRLASGDAVRSRCEELMALVRLGPETLNMRPRRLSGGQKQRVAIARALALEPEVIIADEAVAALDVSVQAAVLNVLVDLRDRLGLTIVLIAHDLAVVRNVCDRVAVMYRGRVVELADTDELFAAPRHPYTRALLDAVPRLGAARSPKASTGTDLGSSIGPDTGCSFAPRCPEVHDACATVPMASGHEHMVACHLTTRPASR